MSKSVLQDWVAELPLRHQGVLLTAIRGCDTSPKEDDVKALARSYRCALLNAFVGDPKKSVSFIEWVSPETLRERMLRVTKNHDHYPHHYIMHLVHAAEILGYYHPFLASEWLWFYQVMCRKLHMTPETKAELDARLTASEYEFGVAQ